MRMSELALGLRVMSAARHWFATTCNKFLIIKYIILLYYRQVNTGASVHQCKKHMTHYTETSLHQQQKLTPHNGCGTQIDEDSGCVFMTDIASEAG